MWSHEQAARGDQLTGWPFHIASRAPRPILPGPRASHIVAPMPAVPVAASRASLLHRLAGRWREARAAALLHSLPHGEVGLDMPAPAMLAARVAPALRGIAHPAVWEVGVPATAAMIGIALWRQGWDGYWPRFPETRLLFLLFHPVWVAAATGVGQVLLRRRYARMAREEYSRRLWHASEDRRDA